MKLRVSCYCAVGPPRWQSVDCYESDECPYEGEIEIDDEEWDPEFFSMECPLCKTNLHASDDHFEAVDADSA